MDIIDLTAEELKEIIELHYGRKVDALYSFAGKQRFYLGKTRIELGKKSRKKRPVYIIAKDDGTPGGVIEGATLDPKQAERYDDNDAMVFACFDGDMEYLDEGEFFYDVIFGAYQDYPDVRRTIYNYGRTNTVIVHDDPDTGELDPQPYILCMKVKGDDERDREDKAVKKAKRLLARHRKKVAQKEEAG